MELVDHACAAQSRHKPDTVCAFKNPGIRRSGSWDWCAGCPCITPMYKARLIAKYLPQFHPIPENDRWWGRGFTEWTNTAKARPLFRGHQKPDIPADLGYYDLRLPEVREAQADLARAYGIEGFCYWHYWFGGGRRLLEAPFNAVVTSGSPDFPFCLAWANQTWSGIWHGCPDRTLMEQTYPGLQDVKNHFYALLPAFMDERYIKINGANVFCIYRPAELQSPELFTETWRSLAAWEGAPDFFFIAITDSPWERPGPEGTYDGYTSNPPLGVLTLRGIRQRSNALRAIASRHPAPAVYEYRDYANNAFYRERHHGDYYPCVIPGWDNTPRAGTNGVVLHNSSPQLYASHLRDALTIVDDRSLDKSVVFIKSWNEWAESNYLEPDLRHGREYLEATLRELQSAG